VKSRETKKIIIEQPRNTGVEPRSREVIYIMCSCFHNDLEQLAQSQMFRCPYLCAVPLYRASHFCLSVWCDVDLFPLCSCFPQLRERVLGCNLPLSSAALPLRLLYSIEAPIISTTAPPVAKVGSFLPALLRNPQHKVHNNGRQQRHCQHARPVSIIKPALAPHPNTPRPPMESR